VVIVHLGRAKAKGEVRRVESWVQVLEAAGATVELLPELPEHRAAKVEILANAISFDWLGRTVPEALSWSWRSVAERLDVLNPDAIVFVSVRAFHPRLTRGGIPTVLDFVDQLSVSYRDRARISNNWIHKAGLWSLARFARRAERVSRPGVVRISDGVGDAEALDAEWFPIVIDRYGLSSDAAELAAPSDIPGGVDVLFFGTLSYPPNVEAVKRLAGLWPQIAAARPQASAIIAGSSPTPAIRALVERVDGWELMENFADMNSLLAQARVAVVPLRRASGMQIKVLDAACRGVAQVVDPIVLRGFDTAFPVAQAATDEAFVTQVLRLLSDDRARHAEGAAAQAYVIENYSPQKWACRLTELV